MVDTVGLVNSLAPYGTIDLIGYNNANNYLVVMSNVTTDINNLSTITTNYLGGDFPSIVSETLSIGVYKLDRSSQVL